MASAYRLPLADASADLLTNVFSPPVRGGVRQGPAAGRHLPLCGPLRPAPLGDEAGPLFPALRKPRQGNPYTGFSYQRIVPVRYEITLDCPEDIRALFPDDPLLLEDSPGGVEALSALKRLTTQVGFDLHVFRRSPA